MKRIWCATSGDEPTLAAFLAARLGGTLDAALTLIAHGAVEIDRRRAETDGPLRPGARVVAFVPDGPVEAAAPLTAAYRDDDVLVVDKPAGLRSQGVRGDDWDTLVARVRRELDPVATLLHRLDREVSGLVLLPRTDRARLALQTALDEGRLERRYTARVRGRLERPVRVTLRIGIDPRDARRRVAHPEGERAGEAAATRVEPLEVGDAETRVRLTLETGRTHQIRVHLSAIGHPVVGDVRYGGPPSERLWLRADELVFPHPRTGAEVRVTAPPDPPA